MANSDLINAFNDCIDRLINGQSMEDCLRLYPQFRDRLLPMLEAGRVVQRVRVDVAETTQAQIRVRNRIQQALMTPPPRAVYPYWRFAALAASFLLVIMIVIAGAAAYSQQSLPGDTLYDLKLLTENIQLSLSGDNTLKQQFTARRITEIQQLLSAGRMEKVRFEGKIAAQNEALWQVASLAVEVSDRIADLQLYKVGDLIRVDGLTTTQGTVLVSQIVLLEPGEQIPPTALPPTVTPLPTKTPSLTPTQQPSATVSPTRSPAPTSVPPTGTTLPSPTSIPVTPSSTVCAAVQPDGWVNYRVQAGDTLSGLATSTSITLDQLMAINCLTDAGRIVTGEQLYLPRTTNVNPTSPSPQQPTTIPAGATDDHGGGSNSGSGGGDDGGGHGGGSDDGSGHG